MKQKNKQVEILRGLLILMIIFFHYTSRFSAIYGIDTVSFYSLNEWGKIGVGCFFLISGYFLIPRDVNNFSIVKFLKRKILRIYPLYLICLTIIFISVCIFGLPKRSVTLLDYFFNAIMLNGFIGIDYVDGAHWYLTYLLIFYVIIAIYLKFFKSHTFFLGWLVLKDILRIGIRFVPFLEKLYHLIGGDYVELILLGILLQMAYQIYVQNKTFSLDILKKYKLEVFLFLLCVCQLGIYNSSVAFIGILFFLIIFATIIFKPISKVHCYGLYFIGNISYILYLIHQNIGYQILLCLFNIYHKFQWYYILITFFIILFLAYIIHVLYSYVVYKVTRKQFDLKKIFLFKEL